MGQGYAILRNTFFETVRQPVFGLILILTGLAILAIPLTSSHVYTLSVGTSLQHAPQRMVAELGLSTILLSGLLLSVFAASGAINREIEEKTALTVLTKRVSRITFILGKFLGIACALALAILTQLILLLLTVRFGSNTAAYQPIDYAAIGATAGAILLALLTASWRNYFFGKSWIGSFSFSLFCYLLLAFCVFFFFDTEFNWAVTAEHFGSYDWQVAIAGLLTLQAILLLCGISVAASTRLGAAGNFCVTAVCFCGGLTSDYFFREYGQYLSVRVWHSLMPNLQSFWLSEALKREIDIPLNYCLSLSNVSVSGYEVVYLAAVLLIAAFLFDRREIT